MCLIPAIDPDYFIVDDAKINNRDLLFVLVVANRRSSYVANIPDVRPVSAMTCKLERRAIIG